MSSFPSHALLLYAVSVQTATLTQHPEVVTTDTYYEKFGIDEVRELTRQAYLQPSSGGQQCLICRTTFITHEAQNALLKILEEPPTSTNITFIVPPSCTLLATLQSRFFVLPSLHDVLPEENAAFSLFLSQKISERIKNIEDATKKKNISWQQDIKDGLITHIPTIAHTGISTQKYKVLTYVASRLLTRGASNKMLLEQLALTL